VAQLRESRIATRTTARHGDQSYETKRTILKVPLCVLRLTRGGKTEPWRAGSLKRPKGLKERENTAFWANCSFCFFLNVSQHRAAFPLPRSPRRAARPVRRGTAPRPFRRVFVPVVVYTGSPLRSQADGR